MSSDGITRRGLPGVPGLAAAQRSAYAAWPWERWRQITRDERPRVPTEQSGHAQLSEVTGPRGELQKVADIFPGMGPAAPPPLEPPTDAEMKLGSGIVRRRVEFQSEPGYSL